MKKLTLLLVFLLGLSISIPATADGMWLHLGMYSKHFNSGNYNESHDLVGLEYKGWYVGHYNNSYRRESTFVFRTYELKDLSRIVPHAKLKGRVGIINGYENIIEGFMPAIVPVLSFDFEPVSVEFNMLVNVYSIEFKIKLH